MAEAIADPLDSGALGGQTHGVLEHLNSGRGWNDRTRCFRGRFQPRTKNGLERDDSPGCGFFLAGGHQDHGFPQFHLRPVQTDDFLGSKSGKPANGKCRNELRAGGIEQAPHLIHGEDLGLDGFRLERRDFRNLPAQGSGYVTGASSELEQAGNQSQDIPAASIGLVCQLGGQVSADKRRSQGSD